MLSCAEPLNPKPTVNSMTLEFAQWTDTTGAEAREHERRCAAARVVADRVEAALERQGCTRLKSDYLNLSSYFHHPLTNTIYEVHHASGQEHALPVSTAVANQLRRINDLR